MGSVWLSGMSRRGPHAPTHLLSVQPSLLEAPAVEDAVDHDRDTVHPRVPAGAEPVMVDHRSGGVLLQLAVDLPNQLFALFLVGFNRLPLVHLLELGLAGVGVVAL